MATDILTPSERQAWQPLISQPRPALGQCDLTIRAPYDGAVFPPEIAAPTFRWSDSCPMSTHWLVVIRFKDPENAIYALVDTPQWTPDRATWEAIKAGSLTGRATTAVYGVRTTPSRTLTSAGRIYFSTSRDRVDATILYRQVPLPFDAGKQAVKRIKWRLGDLASYEKPPVVMQHLSNCASCHQFTADGRLMSIEMNVGGDSGAQVIVPVNSVMDLSSAHAMTWTAFPKPDLLPSTRGLFARLSPGGNYLLGTVNEIAFFALTNDPAYCQLFFPTYGFLAWYDVKKRRFQRLPGADDPDFVQTDPTWSWDEKTVVFARTRTRNEVHDDITDIRTRIEDADMHALNRRYPIRFDLYRMPFNQGRGGVPVALKGASHNGMSNYFARYSPDGRWIVFTRSRSGIMLQPDSELYMIPADGGTARRMRCNRSQFNSWHSFSPNGRWLLFVSKTNSIATEIFLTHIDENGMDSVPVCLTRFSDRRFAANVPEFVNLHGGAIRKILAAKP